MTRPRLNVFPPQTTGTARASTKTIPASWRTALANPEFITVICVLIAVIILWPFGQYAVDDEWAFLKSLQHLHEERRIRILDWNPMSLAGQLFWAVLFTKTVGFSFTAARVSTLTLLIALLLATGGLLRLLGIHRRTRLIVLLALAFNPLCFFHGVLYETDVPACAWTMLSLWLMAIGVSGEEPRNRLALLAGCFCGAIGFLIRQSGLLVNLALLLYLALYDRRRLRTGAGVLATLIIPTVTIAGFEYWYFQVHGSTLMFRHESQAIWQGLKSPDFGQLFRTIFKFGVYVGLFALPVLVAAPLRMWKGITPRRLVVLAILSCYCVAAFIWLALGFHVVFPYLGNKITPFGFLSPNEVIAGDRPVLWGSVVAWGISVLGILALVRLAAAGLSRADAGHPNSPCPTGLRLTWLLALLQFAYLVATSPIVFDRHLLMLLPAVLVLGTAWTRGFELHHWAAAPVVALFALYSIAGTHDVHAFSKAAFVQAESLIQRGASPMTIDGGYAFDGWHTFETWEKERIPRARNSDAWWVRAVMRGVDTQFTLSLSPTVDESSYRTALRPWSMPAPDLSGRHTVETVQYTTWWPPAERQLYVLQRR